eukprot:6191658-Pleurochrysis_carterae.AAC.1
MGTGRTSLHNELTWLFGIDSKGTLLPATHLALVRIYWRHVYAAMVRNKYDGDVFSPNLVKQNIARTFHSRILAFQHARLIRYFRRRFSHHGNYMLPKSEANRVKPLGELRLSDGHLTIKSSITLLLRQQNIECENLQLSSTSPASPASINAITCNNNNNRHHLKVTGSSGVQEGISASLLSQLRQRAHCTLPNLANG